MKKMFTSITIATLLLAACGSGSEEREERSVTELTTPSTLTETESETSVETETFTESNSPANIGPVNIPISEETGLFHLLWNSPENGRVSFQANNQILEVASYLPDGTADYWNYGQTILFVQRPEVTDILSSYVDRYEQLFNEYSEVEAWVQKDLPDPWKGVHSASVGQLITTLLVPESPLIAATAGCVTEFDDFQRTFADAVPAPTWTSTPDGTETWTVPIDDLPYEQLPECVPSSPDEYRSLHETITVERSPEQTIVWYESGIYTDSEPEPVFTIRYQSEPERTLDSVKGERLKLFDPVTWFLVAVNRCEELPYSYSNFAAGNSYTAPDSPNYIEPNPFVSYYVCSNQLPDDATRTSQGN